MASSIENEVLLNDVPLSNYSLDPGHGLYLHHSDNPNCGLTSELLTGGNYVQWRRSFVTGGFPKPASNSPYLPLWKRCDSWSYLGFCIL